MLAARQPTLQRFAGCGMWCLGWPFANLCESSVFQIQLFMLTPRPSVSVGTVHGQNGSGWHPATGGVERAIRQLIIGISHRTTSASWPSEPTRDA